MRLAAFGRGDPGALEAVHALDDAVDAIDTIGAVGGQWWHGVVLVVNGDVVEDILLAGIHAVDAVAHDHRQLAGEGRAVAAHVRHGVGDELGVAVLVLGTFTVQRGAARGAAQQETAAKHVAGAPDHVADPLEAED